MKKSIELLEKALKELNSQYNFAENSVIAYNEALDELEQEFLQRKKRTNK